MTHDQVQEWLDRYIAAWSTSDPVAISGLFSDDAVYSYRPWDSEEHSVTGAEAISVSWLESPDDPSIWEAEYSAYAVDGDRAVALGHTRYFASDDHPEKLYHNAFILRFDEEGRCSRFNEFFLLKKA